MKLYSYPYVLILLLCCGADACARQTPSAEATARVQCASPTDLKVDRTSEALTNLRRRSQWMSLSISNEGVISKEALKHCIER